MSARKLSHGTSAAIASSGSHDLGRDDMKVLDVKFERMGEFQARWPAS